MKAVTISEAALSARPTRAGGSEVCLSLESPATENNNGIDLLSPAASVADDTTGLASEPPPDPTKMIWRNSFERKVTKKETPSAASRGTGAPLALRSLSFGRKPRARLIEPVVAPVGLCQMSGYLWKRTMLKYQKRFFFIVGGKLFYRDPNDETNHFDCGKLTGITVLDPALLEMTIITDERQFEFRCALLVVVAVAVVVVVVVVVW